MYRIIMETRNWRRTFYTQDDNHVIQYEHLNDRENWLEDDKIPASSGTLTELVIDTIAGLSKASDDGVTIKYLGVHQ